MKMIIGSIYLFFKKIKLKQIFYFHCHKWVYNKRVNLGVCVAAEHICSRCNRKAYLKYDCDNTGFEDV